MTPERRPARPDDRTDHDRPPVRPSKAGPQGPTPPEAGPPAPPPAPTSDARRLQRALEGRWLGRDETRWSPRRTLAFVVVASLLLWSAIIASIAALL